MKVAVVQHDIVWEDAPATRGSLEPVIRQAAAAGARLVVLTEMFATGFSMNTEKIAEPPGGPTETWLREQARDHGIHVIGSVAQRDDGADLAVNRAILAGPDGSTHRYDKIHPFSYGREHQFYRAGSDFLTVEVDGVRLTVFVCYDLRFADEFWRCALDTDCYVVMANWPAKRREHWSTLLRARAIENQAWVVAANRIGEDGNGIRYAGDSVVIDPMGAELTRAARIETVLIADIDPDLVHSTREHFPFLPDRREPGRTG